MTYALTFVCIFCACSCWYCLRRFFTIYKDLNEKELHKMWESDLYEKDDNN